MARIAPDRPLFLLSLCRLTGWATSQTKPHGGSEVLN